MFAFILVSFPTPVLLQSLLLLQAFLAAYKRTLPNVLAFVFIILFDVAGPPAPSYLLFP